MFLLETPVVEVKLKPSRPYGCAAQSAWGDEPVFEDRGERRRAICALGRQDCRAEGLTPLDDGVEVLGASSDHLMLDVHDMARAPRPGQALRFRPDYATTVQLATSPYVDKVMVAPADPDGTAARAGGAVPRRPARSLLSPLSAPRAASCTPPSTQRLPASSRVPPAMATR